VKRQWEQLLVLREIVKDAEANAPNPTPCQKDPTNGLAASCAPGAVHASLITRR
jgi:hypothetical protein